MKVKYMKTDSGACAPQYGSKQAAGADLRAAVTQSIVIEPHSTVLIGTGVAVRIPDGLVGLVFARSGIAAKRGLTPANKVGVIDSDYRGEIKVALHNHGEVSQTVEPGERIAQLVVMPYIKCEFDCVKELDVTDRGARGFGSTGAR